MKIERKTITVTFGAYGAGDCRDISDIRLRVKPEQWQYKAGKRTGVKLIPSQVRRVARHFGGKQDCDGSKIIRLRISPGVFPGCETVAVRVPGGKGEAG